jgi:streptogramin lyase
MSAGMGRCEGLAGIRTGGQVSRRVIEFLVGALLFGIVLSNSARGAPIGSQELVAGSHSTGVHVIDSGDGSINLYSSVDLATAFGAAVSATGIVFVGDVELGIRRIDPSNGEAATITPTWTPTGCFDVAIEPTGSVVVSCHNSGLHRVDTETGETSSIAPVSLTSAFGMAIAPSGEILVGDVSLGIRSFDADSGAESPVTQDWPLSACFDISVEQNGDIIVSCHTSGIHRVDRATGLISDLSPASLQSAFGMTVGPDGDTFVGDVAVGIRRFNRSTGAESLVTEDWPLSSPFVLMAVPVPEPSAASLASGAACAIAMMRAFASRHTGV